MGDNFIKIDFQNGLWKVEKDGMVRFEGETQAKAFHIAGDLATNNTGVVIMSGGAPFVADFIQRKE